MRFIVDANMVFSALLNKAGKIGELFIGSDDVFNFLAPEYLRIEIRNHYQRIQNISRLTLNQVQEAEFRLYNYITFISEDQIRFSHWIEAEALCSDIDPKDTHYIAYALHFGCKLWSGDKTLMTGLKGKGFTNIITTQELFSLREEIRRHSA